MAEDDPETVRQRAETCQKLINDCFSGESSLVGLVSRLRDAGATANEARDWVKQLEDRIKQ